MDLDLTTGRRRLLAGGAGLLATAFLAACSDDSDDGESTEAPTTTAPPAPQPLKDLQLSLTFASFELLAIETYEAVEDALATADLTAIAALFKQHHEAHLDTMNASAQANGGEEVEARNAAIYDELIAPRLEAATSQAEASELLADLEQALAETYTWSAGPEGFTAPEIRRTATTIAGVDARHQAVLLVVGAGEDPEAVFPADAFYPAENVFAEIDGALIEPDEE